MSATDEQIAEHVRQTLEKVTAGVSGIPDPADRARFAGAMLDAVPALQTGLREVRQGAVADLRADDWSHADVADLLGVTRARARQIAEGKTANARAKRAARAAGEL